jgi:tRNA(Leu) C34 or U34 (ribose-2'-O)-methylase TrmL
MFNHDRPFNFFKNATPVAIEIRSGSENLVDFEHPNDAVYVFGPEDGSIDQSILRLCHRFVQIPTAHCLNLAAAANIVLYDRFVKEYQGEGLRPEEFLAERRGHV